MADHGNARNNLKKGVDKDAARQKRVDVTVELRKKSRDAQLLKRRAQVASPSSGGAAAGPGQNDKLTLQEIQTLLANLPRLQQMCSPQAPIEMQLKAVTDFRKLLSVERDPPIQQIIDCGIVPRLVQLLQPTSETDPDMFKLQFEAGWALTNIASGTSEHTQCVVRHGALPLFIRLLQSSDVDVKEQAVWALGNIAGDSSQFRNDSLDAGIIPHLLKIFTPEARLSMLRNATWAVSNLCRGKPQPEFAVVRHVLPVLSRLIMSQDHEVLTDAFWALSYLSDDSSTDDERIQGVIEAGVAPRLVQCLSHHKSAVQVPVLRTVGNIVTGNDHQTQAILECNPLPLLKNLLVHNRRSVRKEACWTISNITAGTKEQIDVVINAGMVPSIVKLCKDAEFDIAKEAAWALSNITSGGSAEHINKVVQQGAINALVCLLDCEDSKITLVALEGIENILASGEKLKVQDPNGINYYAEIVEQTGLDMINQLQDHELDDVYLKAGEIIKTYFSEEDDTLAMDNANDLSTQFTFGSGGAQPAAPFTLEQGNGNVFDTFPAGGNNGGNNGGPSPFSF